MVEANLAILVRYPMRTSPISISNLTTVKDDGSALHCVPILVKDGYRDLNAIPSVGAIMVRIMEHDLVSVDVNRADRAGRG